MPALEANFDGIVGPTHNYAGLSPGNLASEKNRGAASSPRRAALQGLAKAKRLADLGIEQHVLPPLERPDPGALRDLGFCGTDAEVIERASREAPALLSSVCSASAMWAANAATVSPGADTEDARLHITPANLAFNQHRGLEAAPMARILREIFADRDRFRVHDPLPGTPGMFDEGAANHMRLASRHGEPGVEVFCWGRPDDARDAHACGTVRFSPRQGEAASRAIARRHGVREAVFVRQDPRVIDAGVFHNDVIAVANEDVLLVHEAAYGETGAVVEGLRRRMRGGLRAIVISELELGIADLVDCYLFNSQIVTVPGRDGLGRMVLIAPREVAENASARSCVDRLLAEAPEVGGVEFVDVRESMRNGGGPACLRLRVVLTDEERAALGGRTRLDDDLYGELTRWAERHYREELRPADLADPRLLEECRAALDDLSGILRLGSVYAFQR